MVDGVEWSYLVALPPKIYAARRGSLATGDRVTVRAQAGAVRAGPVARSPRHGSKARQIDAPIGAGPKELPGTPAQSRSWRRCSRPGKRTCPW